MNKAFKEKQWVGRLLSTSRRNAYKCAINERRDMCKEITENCYKYRCTECKDNFLHCYCLAA